MLSQETIWVIDAGNVICEVNDVYKQFAIDNGAPDLAESSIGMNVIQVIRGPVVVHLYESLLAEIRRTREPVDLTFRCDSPNFWRRLAMHAQADDQGQITFATRMLAGGPMDLHVPVAADATCDEQVVRMCSWCNRILTSTGWQEAPQAVAEMRLLEFPPREGMTHTICKDCDATLAENVLAQAPDR